MAFRQNFQGVLTFGPQDLDEGFKSKNQHILQETRGGGFWLWKPYIILKALNQIPEGDVLFYCDSSKSPIRDITPFIEKLKGHEALFFKDCRSLISQTKRDALEAFGKSAEDWQDKPGIYAAYMFLRNNQKTRHFINRWLEVCQQGTLITDAPSQRSEHPNFKEEESGAHDQALLGCSLTENQDLEAIQRLSIHMEPYKSFSNIDSEAFWAHRRRALDGNDLFAHLSRKGYSSREL